MIRKASEADVPAIVNLSRRFLETTNYGTLLPVVRRELLEGLVRSVLQIGVIFVAEVTQLVPPATSSRVIGMIALVDVDHPITGIPYCDEVAWFVEPEYRNGSVGPRLLAQSEVWAREKGLHMVKMVAPAGSSVGRFYEKLGYSAVETAYQKAL